MDKLDASVGDGLAATRSFIRTKLVPKFPGLDRLAGEDSVTLPWTDKQIVCTSDSFIVDPVIFPGGDLGTLTVAGVVNDLLCGGAWPAFLMLNLILGPQATPPVVDRVLESVARLTSTIDMQLIGGDTKYLGDQPRLAMATSAFGIGRLRWRDRPYSLADSRPGDLIVCTGNIGDHSIAVLSAREGLGFERVVRSDCSPLTQMVAALMDSCHNTVVGMRDLTRGGLGGALFELAEVCGYPVALFPEAVPVNTAVRAATEMLGLDPLFLTNEGKMLVVISASQADELLTAVRATDAGRDAAIIGELLPPRPPGTPASSVLVRYGPGSYQPLDEPTGIPVPRLC